MSYSPLKPIETKSEEITGLTKNNKNNWSAFPFIFLHIPLVLLFKISTLFATGHALLTLLVGIFWIIEDKEPDRPILALAYISGAELLWRGLHAQVFWEYGKYASI